jgi:hypothetical protein
MSSPSVLALQPPITMTNYPLWRAQVLPAIYAAQLDGFLTGIEKAPKQHISINNDDKWSPRRSTLPTSRGWPGTKPSWGTCCRRSPRRPSCTSPVVLLLLRPGVHYLICTLHKCESGEHAHRSRHDQEESTSLTTMPK